MHHDTHSMNEHCDTHKPQARFVWLALRAQVAKCQIITTQHLLVSLRAFQALSSALMLKILQIQMLHSCIQYQKF